MTWHADQTEGRPTGDALTKLQAKRAALVSKAELIGKTPLRNATQSAKIGQLEDLTEIARQIKVIDRKLGRSVV